jgi:hypothetical protein
MITRIHGLCATSNCPLKIATARAFARTRFCDQPGGVLVIHKHDSARARTPRLVIRHFTANDRAKKRITAQTTFCTGMRPHLFAGRGVSERDSGGRLLEGPLPVCGTSKDLLLRTMSKLSLPRLIPTLFHPRMLVYPMRPRLRSPAWTCDILPGLCFPARPAAAVGAGISSTTLT